MIFSSLIAQAQTGGPVATWLSIGAAAQKRRRDKSGDQRETRRTSSQPQHRQDDQGSGEKRVSFLSFSLFSFFLSFLQLHTLPSFCERRKTVLRFSQQVIGSLLETLISHLLEYVK